MSINIYTIEGNIGSGKSTLFEHLKIYYQDNSSVVFLDEPVKEWDSICDASGTTILQKFYQDQTKYAFSFQMVAYISRLSILNKVITEHTNSKCETDLIILTERCLYTDRFVFAQMLFDQGKMEQINYLIYLKWFDQFISSAHITGVIYLFVDPAICSERIRKRSRTGEDNIPLEYLQVCDQYHKSYLEQSFTQSWKKLCIDASPDITDLTSTMDEWVTRVDTFIFYK
jgi:deoxyadenosine/deoxycytidine kinase